jgi:hypothetical protein
MPNWCYNDMSVHGDRAELVRLTEAIARKVKNWNDEEVDGHDLTVLFPVPEELQIQDVFFRSDSDDPEYQELLRKYEANEAKYGHRTWYGWSIENWGTKWSPDTQYWEINDHNGESSINANYNTAWSPASGLIREVSRQFPTLLFSVTSDEEGGSFVCCEAYKNGELISEFGFTLPDDEAMPDELRQRWVKIDEAMESCEFGTDEFDEAWEDKNDWDNEVKEYCENMVWNQLRDKGLIPRIGV